MSKHVVRLWKIENIVILKRAGGGFVTCHYWSINLGMETVLSFCSAITNFTPDLKEWVVWVSDQNIHSKSTVLPFTANLSRLWFFIFLYNWKQHMWILDSRSKPQRVVSGPCNNSFDNNVTALCKILTPTLQKNICSNKHLNSCDGKIFSGFE